MVVRTMYSQKYKHRLWTADVFKFGIIGKCFSNAVIVWCMLLLYIKQYSFTIAKSKNNPRKQTLILNKKSCKQ